jgi:TolB-like protein/Tfp pilus assembly protein PilF
LLQSQSGEELTIPSRKGQALIGVLALAGGHPVSRERITGLLWSERGEQQARSSLRQALTELRKALPDLDPPLLITNRDTAQINLDAVEVDAVTFDSLVEEGTPKALERAAELYLGDLLDGVSLHDPAYEDWVRDERQRLHARACEALFKLLQHQVAEDTERAIATARRLLAIDPLQEAVHCTLMKLYVSQGDRTLALKQYQACRDALAGELGISPEAETERLAKEIRAGAGRNGGGAAGREPEPQTTEAKAEPLPLPNKPSVAVLPFLNKSGDPEQGYFADGITEDIITALTRFRSLFVIGSSSSFHYKDRSPKIGDVGCELGVAYVVEGSVRKAGNRVRIAVQLVDAATGHHVWAEHYDRELEDIFAVQDEVTGAIGSTLAGHLEEIGRRRALDKRSEDLAAYDYLLFGDQSLNQGSKDAILRAREMYRRAIELEPGSARAHTGLSRSYIDELWSDWTTTPDAAAEQAFALAKKAVALDEFDGRARVNLGAAYHWAKSNFELAKIQFDKALELSPNDADCYCLKGWCHALSGQAEQAIVCTEQAIRRSPFDIYDCRMAQFVVSYSARRYDEAMTALGSISGLGYEVNALLAACYAQQGREAEARHAMADFVEIAHKKITDYPGKDQAGWRRFWARQFPFKESSHLDHLLDGLRKAGLPV